MIHIEFKIGKINIHFKRKISDARASTSTASRVNIIRFIYRTADTTARSTGISPKFIHYKIIFRTFPRFRRVHGFTRDRGAASPAVAAENARRKCARERNNHPVAGFPRVTWQYN